MWNKVNVGFDAEEETVNFGTRACIINDIAVYETNTLAAICAGDEKPTQLPQVQAQFLPEIGLCVAIDEALTIFNQDCSVSRCTITEQSKIQVFTVSPCGLFVIVGISGCIKCYHIPTGHEIFTRTISTNTSFQTFATVDCYKENESGFIVVALASGRIFKSTEINFEKIQEESGNRTVYEDICNTITFHEIFHVTSMTNQVISGLSLYKESKSIILGSAQNVCLLNIEIDNEALSELIESYKIKKLGGVVNESVLFALCDDGSVLQICLHTMIPYFHWCKFPVKDFVVLEGNSLYECNLLVLFEEPNQAQEVAFISWPDFRVKYRLPVEDNTFLISQKGSEEILFLEGFGTYELIDTIRIKVIVESQPDLRLERILRRGKFEEAEKFARAFSLDVEIVYKAHVQRLSQDLGPWSSPLEKQKKSFNKILELIRKIKDHNFVAEICVTVIPPDFEMLHTMLMYGMERFSKVTDKSGENLSTLLAKVSMIARRLDTCMLIHGSYTTVEHWIEFPKHDLVISCLNHIKRGEIKESILIWSRHFSDIKPLFTVDKAKLLLDGISKTTLSQDLVLWLQHFIPPILKCFPNIINYVVTWTVQRVRNLEILDNKIWPDSGMDLAKCLLRLIHTPHTESSVLLQSQRIALRNENISHQGPLNKLLQLINLLDDISVLKKVYGVRIQYDQYIQHDHSSFVAVLLERLPLENISCFMEEFFHRLMIDRELDSDTQILQFIQEIVLNCEHWWFWDEAPWEARVSYLIPHIKNIQLKLDAILHVLQSAPVPWTSTVSQLAEQGGRLPHHRALDVKNECDNVPKRLIMKKYSILLDGKDELKLVRLILKRNQTSLLDDIRQLVKCAKCDFTDIYLVVIIYLIENGKESKVWELLKTVEENCKAECISRLSHHVLRLVAQNDWIKLTQYFTFMPLLENIKDKKYFSQLKKIYFLKVEFDINTALNKAYKEHERLHILKCFGEKLSKELLAGSLTTDEAVKKVHRLAYLLDVTVEEGVILLAKLCVQENLGLSLTLTSEIEDLENKPLQVYNQLCTLIGQLISFYKPMEVQSTLIEQFTSVTNKITKRYLAYTTNCEITNICKWVSLLNYSNTPTKLALKTLYADPASTIATAILLDCSVQHLIHSHIRACSSTGVPVNQSINTALSHHSDPTNEIRLVMSTWQRLREEQQDLLCIKLIFEYCWTQKIVSPESEEHGQIEINLSKYVKDVMRKLFRLRNFDVELALTCLHLFSKDDAMNFLIEEAQSVGYNYQKLSAISQLALTYNRMNKIDKHTKTFQKYYVSCKWAKKLNELSLPYKDAFKEKDVDHKQLILRLVAIPSTNIALLKEFCNDMTFDQQECFMMYLKYLLLHWEPDINMSVDPSTSKRAMVVKNLYTDLLDKCRGVLHELGTKNVMSESAMTWNNSIQNELYNLWHKVNCYYYEVYFVLTVIYKYVLLDQVDVKSLNNYQTILEFLRNYTRLSSPSAAEYEQWFQLHPNTQQLPKISEFRLPFTPFFGAEQRWDILKPELSLKTYKIWYDVIPHLKLERDMMCMLTIQRLSSDQLGGGCSIKDKSSWQRQACNDSVLQEIQECVRNIHNQEMASAALYYVVNHMPPGADQMAAAKLCYHQAEQWISLEKNSEKAKAGFAKVQKKYLTVCTSHILHSCGLGRSEYLQLVLQPQELICALYYDPSILQQKTGTLSHCPDINQVVMEIGRLHHTSVLGIQQELLSEWLNPPDTPTLDVSCEDFTQNIAAINNPSAISDNDNIIRACYVLESMDMETAARYLITHAGIREELECRPTAVRLRALQCLCSIATSEVIAKSSGTTLEDIKGNLQNLMFISELEKLGLVWSIGGFQRCDKEDVVRTLLIKASPAAVQLAAAVGCVFKLGNIQQWDQILQLMTSYAMIEELVIVLPELTHLCHLLNNSIFIAAWNCALITPLQKAEYPVSEENCVRVQRSLEMLYCCPSPRQVDLPTMLQHCQRLQNPDLVDRMQPFLCLSQSNPLQSVKQEPIKQELTSPV